MRFHPICVGCFLLLVLVGCNAGETIDGYILEVDEDRLMVAEGMTEKEYSEIKDLSHEERMEMEPAPSLIVIAYEEADDFQAGDYVKIKLEGDIAASYPGQGKAKKIRLIE